MSMLPRKPFADGAQLTLIAAALTYQQVLVCRLRLYIIGCTSPVVHRRLYIAGAPSYTHRTFFSSSLRGVSTWMFLRSSRSTAIGEGAIDGAAGVVSDAVAGLGIASPCWELTDAEGGAPKAVDAPALSSVVTGTLGGASSAFALLRSGCS